MADFDYPERGQITEVKGDIRDRSTVDRAMQGVNIVVHTAAALPLYSKEDIFSTDIDGTRKRHTSTQRPRRCAFSPRS